MIADIAEETAETAGQFTANKIKPLPPHQNGVML